MIDESVDLSYSMLASQMVLKVKEERESTILKKRKVTTFINKLDLEAFQEKKVKVPVKKKQLDYTETRAEKICSCLFTANLPYTRVPVLLISLALLVSLCFGWFPQIFFFEWP